MAKTERIEEPRLGGVGPEQTWLVRMGSAFDPQEPPLVVRLTDRQRLKLCRKDEQPSGDPDAMEVEDRWMSSDHAELTKTERGWHLADLGSSNGTRVWGKRTSFALLADGDVVETGSTFWVFRRAQLPDAEVPGDPPPPDVLGSLNPTFSKTLRGLSRVARTDVMVMLLGATGTGKEVLAKALHGLSGRDGPFLAINTAAVQPNLIASELFGVEKGAHSMAESARLGRIRSARGGTLLLDEIGDMPLDVQATLLRVIQESQVEPVGGDAPVPVDVRFVCATHRDLSDMVTSGRFRADLWARLKGIVLEVPALEDRIEDLGSLIATFLRRYGGSDLSFQPAAYRALALYPWPLNVRELEKTIQTAIALCTRGRIEVEHLPSEVADYEPDVSRAPKDGGTDRAAELDRLLRAHQGNVSAVARSMGYSRMQVHRWLKQLAIDPSTYRG